MDKTGLGFILEKLENEIELNLTERLKSVQKYFSECHHLKVRLLRKRCVACIIVPLR